MENAGKIFLEIVTPYKKVVSEYVSEIRMPGALGELGILPDHAPLLTSLIAGELAYKIGNKPECIFCVSWGFAEVLRDKVTVLVETAEMAHEIDIQRAKEAQEKAEAKLRGDLETDQEYLDANQALKKATARISVATKSMK